MWTFYPNAVLNGVKADFKEGNTNDHFKRVQAELHGAISGHIQCIKLSFLFQGLGKRRPLSASVQAAFMRDLLFSQFKSIVNMIYGDVSYLQTGSSIFYWRIAPVSSCNHPLFSSPANFHPHWQIKSATFWGSYFSVFPSLSSMTFFQLSETGKWQRWMNCCEYFGSLIPAISALLMEGRCRNIWWVGTLFGWHASLSEAHTTYCSNDLLYSSVKPIEFD